MRAFVTYDELKGLGAEVETRQLIKEASSRVGKTVFLSHSSADDDILPGALRVLEGHGGRVYVDKKDPALKEMEIFDIAERLRTTVGLCKRFVLLVTPKTRTVGGSPGNSVSVMRRIHPPMLRFFRRLRAPTNKHGRNRSIWAFISVLFGGISPMKKRISGLFLITERTLDGSWRIGSDHNSKEQNKQ